jgi:hypothetical protein
MEYVYLGANVGTLTVSLTNTTDASIGGYLTAFMFRAPGEYGSLASVLTSSTYAGMTDIPAGSNGSPFPGSWIGGAGIGGTWLGGGSPNPGVAVGDTGQWVFSITGAMASSLSAAAFVHGGLTDDPYAFIVRFRGLADDCSDKVRKNGNSWLCGLPFPDDPPEEQRWTIPAWTTEGTCPDAVVARFGGGGTLVINGAQALMGGQKPLQCQRGYVPENRYVCGGSEENVQADGCTWAVTAFAAPGALTVNQPRVSIIAGTVGSSCEPRLCSATPSAFVHVSGATP